MRTLAQRDVGPDEDEVAALAFQHPGQHRGGQPVGTDEMDLHLRFEGVRADFVQPAEVRVACAGDQQLDVAEFIGGTVHEPLDRVGVGDIERQRDGLAAGGPDLVDQLLALLHPAGAQRNREAASGELGCRRGADTRRRTGHDRGPAFREWFEPGHAYLSTDRYCYGKMGEPADIARMDSDGVGLVDLVSADSLEQLGQRHPCFHAGQVGAEAEVGAAAETH